MFKLNIILYGIISGTAKCKSLAEGCHGNLNSFTSAIHCYNNCLKRYKSSKQINPIDQIAPTSKHMTQ